MCFYSSDRIDRRRLLRAADEWLLCALFTDVRLADDVLVRIRSAHERSLDSDSVRLPLHTTMSSTRSVSEKRMQIVTAVVQPNFTKAYLHCYGNRSSMEPRSARSHLHDDSASSGVSRVRCPSTQEEQLAFSSPFSATSRRSILGRILS